MRERKRTFDADLDLALPDLGATKGVASVSEDQELVTEATYFDTPDRRLAAVSVTVRRQTGDRGAGWRLDLPTAVDQADRHELCIGLGRAVRTVPRRFRTTLAGLVGDRTLAATAATTTRRTVRHLLDGDDRVLASVTDDRVDAVRLGLGGDDDQRTVVAWREVGVTLVDGRPRLLHRVGKALTAAGARPADGWSRLADLLDGDVQRPEAPSRPRDLTQQLIEHRMGELVRELRARDPLVREGLPEGVHTMRVAIRRLRSVLATGRPFLDRDVTDPLRDELAWLADALGEVRDSEVRRERLDSSIDALVDERAEVDWEADRVRSALWSPLVQEHDRALAALDVVLVSERYARLLDQLVGLVAAPPWTELATTPIRGAYLRRTRRELTRVDELMEAAHDPAHAPEERALALHDARRATKRARYAVEPLRPIYDAAAELTTRLKALQTALGEHQDTVVTRSYLHALVQDTRPPLDPAAALTAGALIERESRAAEEYDLLAEAAWAAVARSARLG
jgi:CHAD domain-containing protein